MNGLVNRIIGPLATAAIIAVFSILWSMNARITVLDERLLQVLARSDRNDEQMERHLREIDQKLNEIRK